MKTTSCPYQQEKHAQNGGTSRKKSAAAVDDDGTSSESSDDEDPQRPLSYRTPFLTQASGSPLLSLLKT